MSRENDILNELNLDDLDFNLSKVKEHMQESIAEGSIVEGTVIKVTSNQVIVDVGLKSEGILLKQSIPDLSIKVGDKISVCIERYEGSTGHVILNIERARKEESWRALEESLKNEQNIPGKIIKVIENGYIVRLEPGVDAILARNQLDWDLNMLSLKELAVIDFTFAIEKMEKDKGRITVSQRKASAREILSELKEGDIVSGKVRNVQEYGVFIYIKSKTKPWSGMDGLLHVSDINWQRTKGSLKDTGMFREGMVIDVKVISIANGKLSLGIKQMTYDPWHEIGQRIKVGDKVRGRVTHVKSYGAFICILDNDGNDTVEGLVHQSELHWKKGNSMTPEAFFQDKKYIDAIVISIDIPNKKIGLSMRFCYDNPFDRFAENHKIGDIISGVVSQDTSVIEPDGRTRAKSWLIVQISDYDIEGVVHKKHISWTMHPDKAIMQYTKGDPVKAKVVDIRKEESIIAKGTEFERVNYELVIKLSIRDLEADPHVELFETKLKIGKKLKCKAIPKTQSHTKLIIHGIPESIYCFAKGRYEGNNLYCVVKHVNLEDRMVELEVDTRHSISGSHSSSSSSSGNDDHDRYDSSTNNSSGNPTLGDLFKNR